MVIDDAMSEFSILSHSADEVLDIERGVRVGWDGGGLGVG